ncbi:hypothetical protein AGMMS49975_16610 [Clostridia bacterium]|nr:hypothetical protein AGMMS49975_16610 [Clostridia bacterium]
MSSYTEQAEQFLKDCGAKLKVEYVEYDYYFDNDKEKRDIYRFKIMRNGKQYSAKFGQSIAKSNDDEKPTAYDILACLQKYEPETDMWDFAHDYGYEVHGRTDYEKVSRIHKSVGREWRGVKRLFGDVLEQLQEIS